jgi:hypothetical protein
MNDFLRRKSLPGNVIHCLRPRGHHPARRGQYVTVTQWCARQAHSTKTTNRHSADIRAAGTHYPTCQLVREPVRHFHVFVETSRRSGRARPHRPPTHDLASRHSHVFPDYVTFCCCGHQRVRSLSCAAATSTDPGVRAATDPGSASCPVPGPVPVQSRAAVQLPPAVERAPQYAAKCGYRRCSSSLH